MGPLRFSKRDLNVIFTRSFHSIGHLCKGALFSWKGLVKVQ